MDIGVCGRGYTGSGAVVDLLKEYQELSFGDESEFLIPYFPDGLLDLQRHLGIEQARFYDGDVAIKRFLHLAHIYGDMVGWNREKSQEFEDASRDFVDELLECSWKGYWTFDYAHMNEFEKTKYFRVGNRLNELLKKNVFIPPTHMYLPKINGDFCSVARKYVNRIVKLLGYEENKKKVFNQPFPGNNPELCFGFFENPKAILVERDPRDIYIMVKHLVRHNAMWLPTERVEDFVAYFKHQNYKTVQLNDILIVQFEDLIYEYDTTRKRIEAFLQLDTKVQREQHFFPEMSANNTMLFKRYPEYAKDIAYIEQALPEYLYPFDKYKSIARAGDPFWD